MKAGDKIICPQCGEDTFVKERAVLDGWRVSEKILICSLCCARLASVEEVAEEESSCPAYTGARDALSELLGGVNLERPSLNISGDVRRFCKDCRNFVEHPFHTRCAISDDEVDPMGDCGRYEARSPGNGKKDR